MSIYANAEHFHKVRDELFRDVHSVGHLIHRIAGLEPWTPDIETELPFPLSIWSAL